MLLSVNTVSELQWLQFTKRYGNVKRNAVGRRFAAEAGVELLEISPGYAKARMKVTEKHLNAGGVCQGGALFTFGRFGICRCG